jgi:hypothetical protein
MKDKKELLLQLIDGMVQQAQFEDQLGNVFDMLGNSTEIVTLMNRTYERAIEEIILQLFGETAYSDICDGIYLNSKDICDFTDEDIQAIYDVAVKGLE